MGELGTAKRTSFIVNMPQKLLLQVGRALLLVSMFFGLW